MTSTASRRTWLEVFKRGEGHPARGGWAETLGGVRIRSVGEGHVEMEMDMDERHHQPNAVVQGGIVAALADAAMGMAGMTIQEVGWANTTVEMKINFIRPVIRGTVVAEGRVVRAGRTLIFTEATVTNSEGKLAAKATSSVLTFKMPAREHPRAEVG